MKKQWKEDILNNATIIGTLDDPQHEQNMGNVIAEAKFT